LCVGSQVLLVGDDERLELVPAAVVPRHQLWLFSIPIRDRILEAEKDVSSGRIRSLGSADSLARVAAELANP
jgi:hypothetical protein